jgi:uncharacterized protein (TIGR02453 family)
MARGPYFTAETFAFLRDLKQNNDRDWFALNKGRYEDHLKAPALRLIEDFAPHLREISPHFSATPRSLFRIHRDTRFSKDKSPYKTHVGIHFRHDRSKDAHAPGFYVHVEPEQVFVGLGIWHPDGKALKAIRERIVDDEAGWKRASRDKAFASSFSLEGDSLTRAPKGVDPDHPLIDDLRRKDFIGVKSVPESFATNRNLPTRLAALCRDGVPFVRFLCRALDVPF